MRKIFYILALLAFAIPAFASDAVVGTWKLNPAKTKYTTGAPPKDITLVIVQDGDNLVVTATGANADGSPIAVKYSVPVKGGAGTVEQGSGFDGVTSKRVNVTPRDNSFTKNGKEIRTRHVVVSKDGKTLTSAVKGVDAAGNPMAGDDVYDKQ
jgi:hypothetical protein